MSNNFLSLNEFNNNLLNNDVKQQNNKIKFFNSDQERNKSDLIMTDKYNLDLSSQLRFNIDYSKIIPESNNKIKGDEYNKRANILSGETLLKETKLYDGNRYMLENIKRVALDTSKYDFPKNMVSRGFGEMSSGDTYGLHTRQYDNDINPRQIISDDRMFRTNKNILYGKLISDNINRGGIDTRYLNKIKKEYNK